MIGIKTDENGYITAICIDSGSEDLQEITQEQYKLITKEQSAYRLVNKELVLDEQRLSELEERFLLEEIRLRREKECFAVMDRNRRFFERFSEEQSAELDLWYRAWLDAPQTKIIPVKPEFI